MKIKNKIVLAISIILIVTIILPLLIAFLAIGLDGFGLLLLLMFIGNPITAIFLGILSAADIKKLYWIPILLPVVFILSYWIILQGIILELIIYAIFYLLIGLITMKITKLIKNKK